MWMTSVNVKISIYLRMREISQTTHRVEMHMCGVLIADSKDPVNQEIETYTFSGLIQLEIYETFQSRSWQLSLLCTYGILSLYPNDHLIKRIGIYGWTKDMVCIEVQCAV